MNCQRCVDCLRLDIAELYEMIAHGTIAQAVRFA